MTVLHVYERNTIDLSKAVEDFAAIGPPNAVGLVYSPQWCGFVRLESGKLTKLNGPVPADVYEVRVFHETAELRWRKDPAGDGTGAAAILGEQQLTLANWDSEKTEKKVIDTNTTTYLLWGEGAAVKTPSVKTWSVLAAARIGALPVPVEGLREKGRVLLHAIEYLAEDDCGSAFVFEERLTHLENDKETRRG